jgi:hypothetical protein
MDLDAITVWTGSGATSTPGATPGTTDNGAGSGGSGSGTNAGDTDRHSAYVALFFPNQSF